MRINLQGVKAIVEYLNGFRGKSIKHLFSKIPDSFDVKNKGAVGGLVAALLGLDVNNLPLPDIGKVGAELKTLSKNGKGTIIDGPKITSVSYNKIGEQTWEQSGLYFKTRCIIFVWTNKPMKDFNSWTFGGANYWIPTDLEDSIMEESFNEIKGAIVKGESVKLLSGGYSRGAFLQVRTSGDGVERFNKYGEKVKHRSFYILAKYLKNKI